MSLLVQAKRYGKVAVSLLEETLPAPAFNAFYDFTFPKYKSLVRSAYGIKSRVSLGASADDLRMARTIHEVMPYTLVGIGGLEATWRLCKRMNDERTPGAFVELGVARGGCAALMAGLALESPVPRTMWLFDSFEGLPEPSDEDYIDEERTKTGIHMRPLPKGSCLGTIDEVRALLFDRFRFPAERIELVQGWFQDTLPVHAERVGPIAVLRIDGDWYDSTKCCLEQLFDQVVPGGAVIVDDYQSCHGCERAVDEFLDGRGIQPDVRMDGRGGCYFVK